MPIRQYQTWHTRPEPVPAGFIDKMPVIYYLNRGGAQTLRERVGKIVQKAVPLFFVYVEYVLRY